jgi:hypothetical protein
MKTIRNWKLQWLDGNIILHCDIVEDIFEENFKLILFSLQNCNSKTFPVVDVRNKTLF